MKKLILCSLLFAFNVFAQTSPNLIYGATPSAGQWNSYFTMKMDYQIPSVSGNVMQSNGSSWYSGAFTGSSAHVNVASLTTPTISSAACGAGSNGTITGTDQNGKITIGAATTTACAVVFSNSVWFSTPTACVVTPATSASAATTVLAYISAVSATGFTLSGSVLASTSFYFHCE